MLLFKIKLIKLFKKESLARARKRVRKALNDSSNVIMIYNRVFSDGIDGF